MTATEQNTNWARLTPEFRAHVKAIFAECRNNLHVTSLCAKAELLKELFGLHNLTSTTDPEEMFCVERSKIIDEFKRGTDSIMNLDLCFRERIFLFDRNETLRMLFGDKCLLDTNTAL